MKLTKPARVLLMAGICHEAALRALACVREMAGIGCLRSAAVFGAEARSWALDCRLWRKRHQLLTFGEAAL